MNIPNKCVNINPRLSELARDPVVVAFFQRGERDGGDTFAIPAPKYPVLPGGAFVEVA